MIKIYFEGLSDFEPWSGGKDTWDALSQDDRDKLESFLEDAYPDGMSATELNDLLWHDRETVAEWLGFRNADAMLEGDHETWEEHYKTFLTEEFPDVDEDLIDDFIDECLAENESDSTLKENFPAWLHDTLSEDEDEE